MRIRRSVTRFFGALVIPAVTAVTVGYFGYFAIWGERGVLELQKVQSKLSADQQQLAQIKEDRERLQHRIELMAPNSADADLVEELARGQLMDGAPNQVAVPRN
jgi:cell division protein FtsB